MTTLYEHAGGWDALHRLEDTFYASVLADPLLQPQFGACKPTHVDHLTAFTAESFGGPDRFTAELGFQHLIDVHRGLHITEMQRQRFVDLYLAALDAAGMPADTAFRQAVIEHIEFGTRVATQNSNAATDDDLHPLREVPLWTWTGADADIRILGSLRSIGGVGAVRVEDRFDARVDDVWAALTDASQLRQWLGDFEGQLRQGGEYEARFFASGWAGHGKVEVCEPAQHLILSTAQPPEPGEAPEPHTVEAWLSPDVGGARLAIEERGMPAQQLPAYGAGIQIHFEDLAAHLANRPPCDSRSRFEQLFPVYKTLPIESRDQVG